MNVLVTGACGNLGARIVAALAARGETVCAFDVETGANRSVARSFPVGVDVVWGDVRAAESIAAAVAGRDVVVHVAALLPPITESKPELAQDVNVGGTRNVVEAAEAAGGDARVIFTSSVSVHGPRRPDAPVLHVDDPLRPTDNYTHHKVVCEKLLADSRLACLVFRVGVAYTGLGPAPLPTEGGRAAQVFGIPLETQMEMVHPADVGLAVANAVGRDDVWGHTFFLGGGDACRVRYRDLLAVLLEATGVSMLPDEAFGTTPYYSGWMDTEAGNELLDYGRHTFADVSREVREAGSKYRGPLRVVRPLARTALLSLSPHWREAVRRDPLRWRVPDLLGLT